MCFFLITRFLCSVHSSLSAVLAVSQQCWWPEIPVQSKPFGSLKKFKIYRSSYLYPTGITLWLWLALPCLQTLFAVSSLQLIGKEEKRLQTLFNYTQYNVYNVILRRGKHSLLMRALIYYHLSSFQVEFFKIRNNFSKMYFQHHFSR